MSAGLLQGTLTQSLSQVTAVYCCRAPHTAVSVREKSRLTETLLGTWTLAPDGRDLQVISTT